MSNEKDIIDALDTGFATVSAAVTGSTQALQGGTLDTAVEKGATLVNNARYAEDYDNSVALDPLCNLYLLLTFDSSISGIAAGDPVAEVWVLPGDGAGTELFPGGGDGTTGGDYDPQDALFVGTIHTLAPSTTVEEVLAIADVPLYPDTNRIVVKNISGQTWKSDWAMNLKPVTSENIP